MLQLFMSVSLNTYMYLPLVPLYLSSLPFPYLSLSSHNLLPSFPSHSHLPSLSLSSPQLNVDLHFPRVWNATQRWDMRLTGSQVEVGILFSYVDFVNGQSCRHEMCVRACMCA